MRDMLGNYACPLLVLDFCSSLQQPHMIHTVEDEAAASVFSSIKKTISLIQRAVIVMESGYLTY